MTGSRSQPAAGLRGGGCSEVVLHSARYSIKRQYVFKNGRFRGTRQREKGEFPVYYEGSVRDAPLLPPLIVHREVKLAQELENELNEQCAAPYEWAPGGRKYQEHVHNSLGAALYSSLNPCRKAIALSSNARDEQSDGHSSSDRLERQAEARSETTVKNVLG